MCGRYHINTDDEIAELSEIMDELNKRYPDKSGGGQSAAKASSLIKTGEISPTDISLIIPSIECGRPVPALMRWGFPRWNGGGAVINARSETAAEKNMFRSSLAMRRVAIPTTGFYEWQHTPGGGKKEKYLFALPDSRLFYMAGVFNRYELSGVKTPLFVILTTAANETMKPYHNRMPVLIRHNELGDWFGDGYSAILERIPPALDVKMV